MNHPKLLTVDDQTRTVAEWAELQGLTPNRIICRLAAGWTDKEAVFGRPRKPPTESTGRGGRSPAYRAAVVAALASGLSHREVARDFDVSTASVWKWAKNA